MFRAAILKPYALPMLATSLALSFTTTRCDNDVKAVASKDFFDTKGFPSKINVSISNNTNALTLAGVGMRRKNLYVASVDVYKVGIYVSPSALAEVKSWNSSSKGTPVADILVPPVKSLKVAPPQAKVSAMLTFVRDVGRDSICDAFNEAFVGCDEASIKRFREAMFSTIAADTIKKGEDLGFFFLEDGGLAITKNGSVGQIVHESQLANRLLR